MTDRMDMISHHLWAVVFFEKALNPKTAPVGTALQETLCYDLSDEMHM